MGVRRESVLHPLDVRILWWLFAAAIASSIPTLWFYLIGEEGILVNSSLEMAQRGEWRRLWLFGMDAMHGVFANWLTIIVSNAVGWVHAPGVTRAIMIVCTGLSGLLAAALAWRLYRDATLAALAAVITVTFADVLMYRGWLGYRDPLLAMLVFGAVVCLWLALLSRRNGWLLGVLVFSSAGFLTKGLIAYAYVGAAARGSRSAGRSSETPREAPPSAATMATRAGCVRVADIPRRPSPSPLRIAIA